MASISIEFDNKVTDPPESETVPDIPHFDNEKDFYDYLQGQASGNEDGPTKEDEELTGDEGDEIPSFRTDEPTTGEGDEVAGEEDEEPADSEGDEVASSGADETTAGDEDDLVGEEDEGPTVAEDDEIAGVEGDLAIIPGGTGASTGEGGELNSKGTCKKVIFEDVATTTLPTFPPFENTSPIVSGHKKMWRAGHTNDILALAVGTQEEKVSYVTGLLVPAITLLVCFLFWMLLLLTLKRFGPERVGFLSGRRVKLPPRPTTEENGNEKDETDAVPNTPDPESNGDIDVQKEKEPEQSKDVDEENVPHPPDIPTLKKDLWGALYSRKKKEEFWMKTVVVIACIIVIAMAATMAEKGIQSLSQSFADGKQSINYASNLLTRAEVVVTDLSTGIENFQNDVLDVLDRTNTGLCPTLRPDGICQNAFDLESCDFTVQISYEKNITVDKLDIDTTVSAEYTHYVDASEVADGIKDKIGIDGKLNLRELLFPQNLSIYSKTVNFFSSDWTIITRMNNLANILNKISALADDTEGQVGDFEWVLFIAVAFDLIVGILAACIIIDVVVGKKLPRCMKCFQRRLLFPIFMTCVVLSFIFAMVFLITSMALSDVCIDGPNQRVLSLAGHYVGDGLALDYVSDFLKHWFSQCNKEPVSIREDEAFLNEAQINLQAFESAMVGVTDTVTEFCGTVDQELFADTIATSSNFICALFGLLLNVRDALKCKTWMPLYYNTLYNALCYNGIDGFWTIATTQYTVVLMACIILTFRAVFLDLEIAESDDIETIGAEEKNKVVEESPADNEEFGHGHIVT